MKRDDTTTLTLDTVREALDLPAFDARSAWLRMSPRNRYFDRSRFKEGQARPAAVLILIYPGDDDELTFVLTRRSHRLKKHSGQISLPGGSQDPEDADTLEAAMREACEELSVCADDLSVLGALTPMYVIVSDFMVHPHVAYCETRPEFVPNPAEVDEVIEMPLALLVDDGIKAEEPWELSGMHFDVPFYRLDEHVIWGATAAMLSEFEGRLRSVLSR